MTDYFKDLFSRIEIIQDDYKWSKDNDKDKDYDKDDFEI